MFSHSRQKHTLIHTLPYTYKQEYWSYYFTYFFSEQDLRHIYERVQKTLVLMYKKDLKPLCVLNCFSSVQLCDLTDCSPPGSSVHGILQARILEWVAISFSRGSSRPRDQTHASYVSCTGRQVLYHQCHLGSPKTFKIPNYYFKSNLYIISNNRSIIF